MKVYFENCGELMYGSQPISRSIRVYIRPTKDGHGYCYTSRGELMKFAYTHPSNALCIDHKLIPEEHWLAFRYGEYYWNLDSKYDFTIENIFKYAQHRARTTEEVRAERKLSKVVINNEQDVVNALPLIGKCGYLPQNFCERVREVCNLEQARYLYEENGIPNYKGIIHLGVFLDYLRSPTTLSSSKCESPTISAQATLIADM